MFFSYQKPRTSRLALSILGALASASALMVGTTASAALGDPIAGSIQACVEPAGAGNFTINTTEGATTGPAPIGSSDAVPPGSLVVAAGTCAAVATSNVSGGTTAFTIGIVLGTFALTKVTCVDLNGSAVAIDCDGPEVTLDVNFYHGSVVKFHVRSHR